MCVRTCMCVGVGVGARTRACAIAPVDLLIQHAMRVCHISLKPVWFHYIFPHYFIKGTNFGQTILNTKCVF